MSAMLSTDGLLLCKTWEPVGGRGARRTRSPCFASACGPNASGPDTGIGAGHAQVCAVDMSVSVPLLKPRTSGSSNSKQRARELHRPENFEAAMSKALRRKEKAHGGISKCYAPNSGLAHCRAQVFGRQAPETEALSSRARRWRHAIAKGAKALPFLPPAMVP
jgi:hypothetical protein